MEYGMNRLHNQNIKKDLKNHIIVKQITSIIDTQ